MTEAGFQAGPEGGTGVVEKPKKAGKELLGAVAWRLASMIWVGLNGYYLYAFCYTVVWHHVRKKTNKGAIAILVIFCWLNLHLVVAWVAIQAWGPGKVTPGYSTRGDTDPDAAFVCNEQGYSLYCSYCKHIKPNRTHHASFTDTCVPEMDHFCPWVGNVLGQGNIKFFLQFIWTAVFLMVVVLVTLFVYQHDQVPHINGNSIALYPISVIAFLFSFTMVFSQSLYVALGHTSLEHAGYRTGRLPYVNFLWRGDERRIVRIRPEQVRIPRPSPFDRGPWQNIREVMGPIWTWTLPIRGRMREPQFSPAFLDILRRELDEEVRPAETNVSTHATDESEQKANIETS